MNNKHFTHPTENYISKAQNLLELDQTIAEAIEMIRKKGEKPDMPYYYVLDAKGHLIGLVNVRELLIQDPETPIKDVIKTNLHAIQANQTMYEAMVIMQKFHLLAIPILKRGVFLGVVELQEYFDEELHVASKRKRLQIFQMLGILVEEGPTQSLWKKYTHRMPWVFCNMLGGVLCAIISGIYEVVLMNVIILAMFIPLVLSLSESISMQAMTVSIYLMTHKKHKWRKVFLYTLNETKLFLLIALTASVSVGLLSLFWNEGVGPSLIIGFSILMSIIITAILGAIVPIVLHRWRLDPKVASGPIVLMFADVITTLIYLSLAFFLLL